MAQDEPRVVAYLGPEASYTHQATLDAFPSPTTTLLPQITIADVFTAVQSRTASLGVVPFENSSNGSVVFTLDLIADIHGFHPDILVCGERYVDVKHCLLGHLPQPSSPASPAACPKDGPSERSTARIDPTFTNPLAVPACDLSKIKTLYSHPQAWGQCKAFLAAYLKGVERRDVSSTSKAAEIVSRDLSGESAALSSKVAAGVFGVDVLAESINDRVGNATRFLVIRRKEEEKEGVSDDDGGALGGASSSEGGGDDGAWKSLVTFTVDHANPGALAQCLAVFAKYRLNLTSINTRPSGVENWNYIFFVEFKGRKERGSENGKVNLALKEVREICDRFKWLGSWENRLD